MRRLFTPLCVLLGLLSALPAMAALYATGQFNDWDALNPLEFEYSDGLYTAEIDFSVSEQFKLSTVKGSTGNGWTEFDTGTLVVKAAPSFGLWLPLAEQPDSKNQSAPAKKKIKVVVDLEKMMLKYEGDAADTAWSGTLPVLFINTEGGQPIVEKETYLTASYYLDPMGLEGVEAIGSAEAPLTTQIKGRGNYTWTGFEKKPYRLKLADKQPLLGMPKSKHFVLLAHADDNFGFQRNECGFTISRLIGMPWTPESQPIELVINGDYRGLYFLTQNIRIDKDRVNIVEQDDLATTDVDGGWLVEIDNYDTDPHVTVLENGRGDAPIWFTYKSPEVLSPEQENYLQTAMQSIDNAVYASDIESDSLGLGELIDFDTLARYYITQEIVDDCESFHGSCYLYRDRGADCKWQFGPVWDFGNAFWRGTDKFIWQDPPFSQVWIGSIYRFKAFREAVSKVWSWWLGFGPDAVAAHAIEFGQTIEAAAACDRKRWPQYGNADVMGCASQAVARMQAKTEWLKQQWGSTVAIEAATASEATLTDVYTLQGIKVLTAASKEQISHLPAGIYLTPAGKIHVK